MTTTVTGSPEARFLTVAEAADELHVAERFIRKLIANGDLDAVRIGTRLVRIRDDELGMRSARGRAHTANPREMPRLAGNAREEPPPQSPAGVELRARSGSG